MSTQLISSSEIKPGDIIEVQSQGRTITGKVVVIDEGSSSRPIRSLKIEFTDGRKEDAQHLEFDEGAKLRLVKG